MNLHIIYIFFHIIQLVFGGIFDIGAAIRAIIMTLENKMLRKDFRKCLRQNFKCLNLPQATA